MQSITHGRPPKGFSANAVEKSMIAALVSVGPSTCPILGIEDCIAYMGIGVAKFITIWGLRFSEEYWGIK
jgi:hypothetical protein